MAITNYAESWTDVYSQYVGVINFVAGDYDSLRSVMREYIASQNPEHYNDWNTSSEVAMFVNATAYLGENINYRIDLNVHDLFPSTTNRKQSLLNFAKLLSYASRRNICANGLGKLTSVSTTQDISDSLGNNLKNVTVNWNDSSNPNWLEQFLTVMNSSFLYTNPYGKPYKSTVINNISNQLYQFNNTTVATSSLPFSAVINGSSYSFDVVNPEINLLSKTLYENTPAPENTFNMLYRNDGAGYSSDNTGFFVFWKQGSLTSRELQFNSRIENNYVLIDDKNINEYDVWFEELDSITDYLSTEWTQIPGNEYLSYTNVDNNVRSIYKVETLENDTIKLRFSDGIFGDIPYGKYKVYYRISNGNSGIYIRPSDIRNISVSIPYYNNSNSNDSSVYYLTMTFSVQNDSHIRQSLATQSLESIREGASSVYSTQNRMVSASDYNFFPRTMGQSLRVIKAIERTYAGNSRYVKLNDPTGTYKPVNVLATDGYLYGDSTIKISDVLIQNTITDEDAEKLVYKYIIPKMSDYELTNLYYEYYDGFSFPPHITQDDGSETSIEYKVVTDYVDGSDSSYIHFEYDNQIKLETELQMLKVGQMLFLRNATNDSDGEIDYDDGVWVRIEELKTFEDDTIAYNPLVKYYIKISEVLDLDKTYVLRNKGGFTGYCPYVTNLPVDVISQMITNIIDNVSFIVTFGVNTTSGESGWYILTSDEAVDAFNNNSQSIVSGNLEDGGSFFNIADNVRGVCWMFRVTYNTPENYWRFENRSRAYVFGSNEETSFFFDTSKKDENNNFETDDYIKVTKYDNGLDRDYYWKPYKTMIYTDGYIDPMRFKIRPYDGDKDSSLDSPTQFTEIIKKRSKSNTGNIIFLNTNSENEEKEYLTFTDLTIYPDGREAIGETHPSVEGTMWNYVTKSGYYYLRHKCNKIYAPNEKLKHISAYNENVSCYAPQSSGVYKVTLSNGKTAYLNGESYRIDTTYDYAVVDSNIVEYVDGSIPVYGDNRWDTTGQGYLYYYNANSYELTEFDPSEYTVQNGINNLTFLWKHMPNEKYTVDPCPSNIIDMYVLTTDYYNEVQEWIKNDKVETFPKAPSSYELKSIFSSLENNKMISDELVWHPIKYKLVFGEGSDEVNKCVFKVVKKNDNISDNEIKKYVVSLIDNYFQYMDVGQAFYFTKLSTYIHNSLSSIIDTVLIVPTNNNETFGSLFEIACEDNEIILSSASLDDVEVIGKITSQNLRISSK